MDETVNNSPLVSFHIHIYRVPYKKALVALMFSFAIIALLFLGGFDGGFGTFIIKAVVGIALASATLQTFIMFYSDDPICLIAGIDYYTIRKNHFDLDISKIDDYVQ